MDDDLGDSDPASPGYGGKLVGSAFRTAGAIWSEAGSIVVVSVYVDAPREIEVQVYKPDSSGAKSTANGSHSTHGLASANAPVVLQFVAGSEGYLLLTGKLTNSADAAVRSYFKVEYQGPSASTLF